MALLTIVLGLLLAGGGGFFVILGFDIVMTDRGAAMTIAGTMALSGGIVTLGLGFAILRLSHILRALEHAAKASSLPGRGIDDIASARVDIPAPAPAPAPTTALVGGGALAAGAAVLAAGANGEPAGARVATDAEPMVPDDAGLSIDTRQVQESGVGDTSEDAVAGPAAMDAPDDESTIAAEANAPGEPVPTDGEAAGDMVGVEPAHPKDLLDDDIFADLNDILREDAPVPENAGTSASPPDPANLTGSNDGETSEGDDALSGDDTLERLERVPVTAPDPASDLPDRPLPMSFSSLLATSTESGPKVLGSYNAGGRTYTMYSDGSVEAVTENGVERFSSMESLRQHLART